FCSEGNPSSALRLSWAMLRSSQGSARRCPMAMTVQQRPPVAHGPLVRGVLRRLEVATLRDGLIPPPPAPGRACGRGGAAWGLALREGQHALAKGGKRLEERGRVTRLPPGRTRAALQAERLGHLLDALWAATRHPGWGAIALQACAASALPTPWRPPATTTR